MVLTSSIRVCELGVELLCWEVDWEAHQATAIKQFWSQYEHLAVVNRTEAKHVKKYKREKMVTQLLLATSFVSKRWQIFSTYPLTGGHKKK